MRFVKKNVCSMENRYLFMEKHFLSFYFTSACTTFQTLRTAYSHCMYALLKTTTNVSCFLILKQ